MEPTTTNRVVCANRLPASIPAPLVVTVTRDTKHRGRDARWTVNVARPGVAGRITKISTDLTDEAPTARASAWIMKTLGLDVDAWDRIGGTDNWKGRVAS